ncbi:MAG: metal-dependent hydrolase [Pseudonocardia sp.]
MMGRTHALTGAMVFGLAASAVESVAHLTAGELLLGTAVCAGAAVLPDIDHPGSGISRTLGPLTQGFALLVAWTSGGHRNGTHSLAGVAVFTLLAFAAAGLHAGSPLWLIAGLGLAVVLGLVGFVTATVEPPGRGRGRPAYRERWHGVASAWIGAGVAVGLAVAALLFPHRTGLALLALLLVLVLSATARIVSTRRLLGLKREWDDVLPVPITAVLVLGGADLRVVPVAVALGVIVHIAGDMVTLGGCPLGWPWSQTMRGPRLFRTNSGVEHRLVFPACTAVLGGTVAWNSGLITALSTRGA